MKIFELFQPLLEYSRAVTLQKMTKQLQAISDTTKLEPADVLEQLENIDPTKNKQYVPWLVKQLATSQFRLEDRPRINKLLTDFLSIKNRLPQEQRDLGRLSLYQLDDIVDQAMNAELATDKERATDTGTFPVVPGSKILYNGPLGQLAIPETEEASCELGRGTKWCTAAKTRNMFSHYSEEGPLYVWRDKNGEKYQFHFGEEAQLMDSRDRPLSGEQIAAFRKHPVLSKMFKKAEAEALSRPDRAVSYAADVIQGRWPEAEQFISTDPYASEYYARNVLKARWPEAEPVIMRDPYTAMSYANDVIEDRWPEAEPVIMKDPRAACEYAMKVLKRRWPEAERHIKTAPHRAAKYAMTVIKGRWPEAEQIISTDPYASEYYARNVLKARWPEAEPVIMRDPYTALRYALHVIEDRWPEAEQIISTDPNAAAFYAKYVLERRWPEAEPVIKRDSGAWDVYKRQFNIV